MHGEPNRRKPVSLSELAGVTPRRRPVTLAELAGVAPRERATLAVDTDRWLREVAARAQLPAELVSVLVQAYVVAVLREPQAKTPQGRSAVLKDIRDLLEDAIFAGIKEARPPCPEKPPLPPSVPG